jgi:hypothetical protein
LFTFEAKVTNFYITEYINYRKSKGVYLMKDGNDALEYIAIGDSLTVGVGVPL